MLSRPQHQHEAEGHTLPLLGLTVLPGCHTVRRHLHAGVTQLVECNLAKVDVAGSSPVSRSRRKKPGSLSQVFLCVRTDLIRTWHIGR